MPKDEYVLPSSGGLRLKGGFVDDKKKKKKKPRNISDPYDKDHTSPIITPTQQTTGGTNDKTVQGQVPQLDTTNKEENQPRRQLTNAERMFEEREKRRVCTYIYIYMCV